MARKATKAANNMYYKARMRAAEFNDKLKSREGAAELLSVDPTTLAKYELETLRVSADIATLMAEVYNAPELLNYHCTTDCVIGCKNMHRIEEKPITVVSLQMIHNLQEVECAKNTLLDIVQDGIISKDEEPMLQQVMEYFEKIKKTVDELQLWAEKNIKKEHLESAVK